MSSAQLQLVGPVVITKVLLFQFAPLPGDRCCKLGCFRGRRVPWSDGNLQFWALIVPCAVDSPRRARAAVGFFPRVWPILLKGSVLYVRLKDGVTKVSNAVKIMPE